MNTPVVLGLDIGGANLKAATADRRAVTVPFALWKQPDTLPAALAGLVAQFPDATEFAVTMTGELCDCYETKRVGVNAILDAVEFAASGRPVRVWSTAGGFVSVAAGRAEHLKVAAANWHALATYAGRYAPTGGGFLIDVGSTTSDLIPLNDGRPVAAGTNDYQRHICGELAYVGVRRTPVCAIQNLHVAAEFFATTHDVCVVLGKSPESADDRDTADGRPATRRYALARLARMLCADTDMLEEEQIVIFAEEVYDRMVDMIWPAAQQAYWSPDTSPPLEWVIVSGAGEFVARKVARMLGQGQTGSRIVSLNDELGPAVSACAPAFALAVLGTERRP